MSIADDRRERPQVSAIERHMLRIQLFNAFWETRTYQNVIADLRHLWKEMAPEAASDSAFWQLRSHRYRKSMPAVATYLEAIDRKADRILNLRWKGQPARWAGAFIHADVDEESPLYRNPEPDPTEPEPAGASPLSAVHRELHLGANPIFGVVQIGTDPMVIPGLGGELPNVPPEHEARREFVQATAWMQFAEWEELRKKARAAVEQIVAEMQAEYESWYPDTRRPSTKENQPVYMAQLAAWLLDPNLTDWREAGKSEASGRTIARCAALIGVDYSGQ